MAISVNFPRTPQEHLFINTTIVEVEHGMGHKPVVRVIDTNGNIVQADIQHVDNNNVTVTFIISISGTVFIG